MCIACVQVEELHERLSDAVSGSGYGETRAGRGAKRLQRYANAAITIQKYSRRESGQSLPSAREDSRSVSRRR